MQERIKQIPTKFVEFWNKYTGVQKTIIISVICVVLLAIGLTTYFVSRPTWVKFNEFNNKIFRIKILKLIRSEDIVEHSYKTNGGK